MRLLTVRKVSSLFVDADHKPRLLGSREVNLCGGCVATADKQRSVSEG